MAEISASVMRQLSRDDVPAIERKIINCEFIENQLFYQQYSRVVQFACQRLPRDCQFEIINFLSPRPFPSALVTQDPETTLGLTLTVLPIAKDVPVSPRATAHLDNSNPIGFDIGTLVELRRSFRLSFDFPTLDSKLDHDVLFYLVVAFGSEDDQRRFWTYTPRAHGNNGDHHPVGQMIYVALKYRNVGLLRSFLDTRGHPLVLEEPAFFSMFFGFAAEFGLVKLARLVVQHWACDPAFEENYALQRAAGRGHLKMVRYLMEDLRPMYARIDPTARDSSAIRWATIYGQTEVAKYFTEERWSRQQHVLKELRNLRLEQ